MCLQLKSRPAYASAHIALCFLSFDSVAVRLSAGTNKDILRFADWSGQLIVRIIVNVHIYNSWIMIFFFDRLLEIISEIRTRNYVNTNINIFWKKKKSVSLDNSNYSCVALTIINESVYEKTYKMVCAPSEDSDHPGHSPSLILAFAVRMKKAWLLSYPLSAQQRLWSNLGNAQADLRFRSARMPHAFCRFCNALAKLFKLRHVKLYFCHKLTCGTAFLTIVCAPSEYSDQPVHPRSLNTNL